MSCQPFARLRLVIALVLAVAIGCAPPFRAFAHDPQSLAAAAVERHAALGDPLFAEHDHGQSHDDGGPDEQRPGHTHGHGSADHTHDTGHAAVIASELPGAPRGSAPAARADDRARNRIDRLDRPPRVLS
jgi:hypothetical protein